MADELHGRGLAIVRQVLGEQVDEYGDDTALINAQIEDIGLDSLVKLDLVLQLEDAYFTMADETAVAGCETIGELISLVSRSSAQS
jgi:acyl carrier protein